MRQNLEELVKQWDDLSSKATEASMAYAEIDALSWFNYLAFDIIGDLVGLCFTASREKVCELSKMLFRLLERRLGCWKRGRTSRKLS